MTRIRLRPPGGPLDAAVNVPGSKSVANRVLICAALADGVSTISGLPPGDDTRAIVDTLFAVGRLAVVDEGRCRIEGTSRLELPGIVDAGLAGTSSRFLTAVAALSTTTTVIDGDQPLRSRPMHDLHDALVHLGVSVTPLGDVGHLPVAVTGGSFGAREVSIRGDVSSQFISALMLIAPLLPQGLSVLIDGHLVSKSYVDMTAHVMAAFGARVRVENGAIHVDGGGYTATDYRIEPDFSSAAFPLCAVLMRPGRVRVPGLAAAHLQGDSVILQILAAMGATVVVEGGDVVVTRDPDVAPTAIDMDMSDCSDLVPAVSVCALAARGTSRLTGIGFIRNKESDRIGDLVTEIGKTGGKAYGMPDALSIDGGSALHPATIDSHHDHRMVMAMSLVSILSGELELDDAEAVSKSWPTFFEDMGQILGACETAR